ncbi:MAG: ABC transporter permease [Ruminiclostridium sp.]
MSLLQMIWRCTETEFVKIISQKKYRVMVFLAALLPVALALIHTLPGSLIQFSMGKFPYTMLSVATYFLIPLTAFMMASDLFAGEQERGELKIMLTKPVSRISVSLGKFWAMLLYHVVILAVLLVLSSIISILEAGFGASNLLSVWIAYSLTLVPAMTICAMASLVATLTHTSTASFSICLLGYLGTMVVGLVFSGIAPALFTNYSSIYKMVIGSSIPIAQLLFGIGILLGYGMIFISAQIMIFEKKES